jgi:hypothetical protein
MKWQVDKAFEISANKDVIAFLKEHAPSAHSDLVDEFRLAAQEEPGARFYCPDTRNYAFFALHNSSYIIVALALGMKRIVFRVPNVLIAEALQDGGTLFSEIGAEWVSFSTFSTNLPLDDSRRRLRHWCSLALNSET